MVVAYLVILVRKGYNGEFLFGNSFFLGVNGLPGSPGMQGPRGERGMQRKSFLNYRQMMIVLRITVCSLVFQCISSRLAPGRAGSPGTSGAPGLRGLPGDAVSIHETYVLYLFQIIYLGPSWSKWITWLFRQTRRPYVSI